MRTKKDEWINLGGTVTAERFIDDSKPVYEIDAHYVFMGIWAFNHIRLDNPIKHIDIGGDVKFLTLLSQLVPVEHRDIRDCGIRCSGFTFVPDNGTALILPDNSVKSLSCLHVAEHIGLGRYGDEIDPEGFNKICRELRRVLAPGGKLYFAVPLGKTQVVFNAHRVLSPTQIMDAFGLPRMRVLEHSFVDSSGRMVSNCAIGTGADDHYGCGMFVFTK